MSDGTPYFSSSSNAGIVWTGFPGQFAMVTTATSVGSFAQVGQPTMDVVVAVSNDNGMNFGPAAGTGGTLFVVSNHNSSGAAGAGRIADRPVIYAEAAATHVAWVAWANPDFHGCGTQNWIRRLHFLSTGQINFGPITEIRIDCNASCVWFDASNIAAYCDPAHAAIDNCVGGTETTLVAFPRVNNGITSPTLCWVGGNTILFANQSSCTGPNIDLQWKVAISQNPAGAPPTTWTQGVGGPNGSAQMNEDLHWPQCAVPSAHGANNRSRPVTIHDDITGQWHVYYTMETFKGVAGARSGLRVFHDMFNDNFTSLPFDFEELDPVTTIGGVGCGGPTVECLMDQFSPMGAWSPSSAVTTTHAVAWYDTRRDRTTPRGTVWGTFSKGNGFIGTFLSTASPPGGDLEIAQAGLMAPWVFSGTNGVTAWGAYNGMGSDHAGTFFPAYGDNRLGGSETQVFVRGFQP